MLMFTALSIQQQRGGEKEKKKETSQQFCFITIITVHSTWEKGTSLLYLQGLLKPNSWIQKAFFHGVLLLYSAAAGECLKAHSSRKNNAYIVYTLCTQSFTRHAGYLLLWVLKQPGLRSCLNSDCMYVLSRARRFTAFPNLVFHHLRSNAHFSTWYALISIDVSDSFTIVLSPFVTLTSPVSPPHTEVAHPPMFYIY